MQNMSVSKQSSCCMMLYHPRQSRTTATSGIKGTGPYCQVVFVSIQDPIGEGGA